MIYMRIFPAILSSILLAAHFFRAQHFMLMLLSLAVLPLAFLRKQWSLRAIQVFLVFGGLEWLRTLWILATQREALGMPWMRMSVILAGVVLFTLGSSLVLNRTASSFQS